ncbi:MAG TPA: VacJ family lipoprotein [Paracoccaceae bacterium]|nr:VacJ family lipoprotein [Paracoccaceae bacterium]HMO70990.1 VacJ family lipoprotein [Paracoccaceae bacterium]
MSVKSRVFLAVLVGALALGAGCSAPPPVQPHLDPDEAQNRQVHAFNRGLDQALLRPASGTYGGVLPAPVRQGVSNFAGNLDVPGDALNSLLQGRPGPAAENVLRFAINSTVGIGGLFDPARALGIEGRRTDFGETLHVWGVPEGAYQELPFFGPSTDRDTAGALVDLAINPVRLVLPRREGNLATATKLASTLGDRYQFGETFDSILYESADSYAQARLLYLQNRRFALGQTGGEDDFIDPYAE